MKKLEFNFSERQDKELALMILVLKRNDLNQFVMDLQQMEPDIFETLKELFARAKIKKGKKNAKSRIK